jgi:2-oxoglutarate ferredoxin oxidoreductase subunit alpha
LEKEDRTGNVSYDPQNHQKMVDLRQKKVALIADDIPLQQVTGPETGELLVVSWGGTFGACLTAVREAQARGKKVSHVHLRYIHPLPRNLGQIFGNFSKLLVPELNKGQLLMLLRSRFLVDAVGLNKVQGRPFSVSEVVRKIMEMV